MSHMWGDKNFDWDALGLAMDDIQLTVKKELGLTILLKEKYGTIRYEFTAMWQYDNGGFFQDTLNEETLGQLKSIILEIADKYPHIKDEILEDFYDTFYSGEMP